MDFEGEHSKLAYCFSVTPHIVHEIYVIAVHRNVWGHIEESADTVVDTWTVEEVHFLFPPAKSFLEGIYNIQ